MHCKTKFHHSISIKGPPVLFFPYNAELPLMLEKHEKNVHVLKKNVVHICHTIEMKAWKIFQDTRKYRGRLVSKLIV